MKPKMYCPFRHCMVPIRFCIPSHKVTHIERARQLAESLDRYGWNGRPLIGYDCPGIKDAIQLLTGVHRLAAASYLGWEDVPVDVVPWEEVHDAYGNVEDWKKIIDGTKNLKRGG